MNEYANALARMLDHQIVDATTLISNPVSDRLFIDVRLGEPDEQEAEYLKAHIFGAVYGQIRDCFAGTPGPDTGNLPLPESTDLQNLLNEWQVGTETEIVVYGPAPALAARAWWVLKWAGVDKVRILDGGLTAWMAAGGPLAQGTARPRNWQSPAIDVNCGQMPDITLDEVAKLKPDTVLLDARDETSFLSGCIPDAINLPAADLCTPSSTMRSPEDIRLIFRQAGISADQDLVVYCGGGVLSALTCMALSAVGARPRLFVGSWSEWIRNPEYSARTAEFLNTRSIAELTGAEDWK